MTETWIPVKIKAEYLKESKELNLAEALKSLTALNRKRSGKEAVDTASIRDRLCRKDMLILKNSGVGTLYINNWLDSLVHSFVLYGSVISLCDVPKEKTGKKVFLRLLSTLHELQLAEEWKNRLIAAETGIANEAGRDEITDICGFRWKRSHLPDPVAIEIAVLVRKFTRANAAEIREEKDEKTCNPRAWWLETDITVYRLEKRLLREFLSSQKYANKEVKSASAVLEKACHKADFSTSALDPVFAICRNIAVSALKSEFPEEVIDDKGLCFEARNLKEILAVWIATKPGIEFRICPICGIAFRSETGDRYKYCNNHAAGKIRRFQQLNKKEGK